MPALAKMELLRRGSRLAVQPVTKVEFETILRLGRSAKPANVAAAGGGSSRRAAGKPTKARKRAP